MSNKEHVVQRIVDMLAELEADRRKYFDYDELATVLGEEKMIGCVAATMRLEKLQRAQLELMGIDYFGKGEPGVLSYGAERFWRVRDSQTLLSHIETAERNMASMSVEQILKPNAGGTSLEGRMFSWHRQLKEHLRHLKFCYSQLTERERMFFTAPVPNATRCDQMPKEGVASLGIFYPRRSPRQRAQTAALEAELARLVQEN